MMTPCFARFSDLFFGSAQNTGIFLRSELCGMDYAKQIMQNEFRPTVLEGRLCRNGCMLPEICRKQPSAAEQTERSRARIQRRFFVNMAAKCILYTAAPVRHGKKSSLL